MGVSVDGLASRQDDDEELFQTETIEDFQYEDYLVDEDAEMFLNEAINTETEKPEEKIINWQGYNPEMLRTKRHQCLNTSKPEINALKKEILQQQLRNNQEEYKQKLMHAAEEHRMKMKILEAELKLKENINLWPNWP